MTQNPLKLQENEDSMTILVAKNKPSGNTVANNPNTSFSILKALSSKTEALRNFEEQLAKVEEIASKYFLTGQPIIPLKALQSLTSELGPVCNYDLSRLPRYILDQQPKLGNFIPFEDFLSQTRQWLEHEPRVNTSDFLNELSEERKTLRMSSIDTFRRALEQNSADLKSLFLKMSRGEMEMKIEKIPEYIRAALKKARIVMEESTAGNQAEIIDAIVEYIVKTEDEKDIKLGYDAIVSYLESYIVGNEEVMVTKINEPEVEQPRPHYVNEEKKAKVIKKPLEIHNEAEGREEKEETDPLKKHLKETISQYELLLEEQKQQGKDLKPTQSVIELLKSQLESNNTKKLEPKKLNAKIEKNLKEIFTFYCKQQSMIGRKPTFEQLQNDIRNMSLGEFMCFCKDFKVSIKAAKVQGLFKKNAKSNKELDFNSFLVMLQKLANQLVDDKIENLKSAIAEIDREKRKEKTAQLHSKENFDEEDSSKEKKSKRYEVESGINTKKDSTTPKIIVKSDENEMVQVEDEKVPSLEKQSTPREVTRKEYKEEIDTLMQKTENEKLSEFYQYLECEDPAKYRKKMNGLVLPFNTKDKSLRIPQNDLPKHPPLPKKSKKEIQREVEKIRKERLQKKKEKEKLEQEKYIKSRKVLQKIYEYQLKERISSIESSKELQSINAGIIQQSIDKNEPIQKRGPQKLTWNIVKNLSYADINSSSKNILPSEFINESCESDKEDVGVFKKAVAVPQYNRKLKEPRKISKSSCNPISLHTIDVHELLSEENEEYDEISAYKPAKMPGYSLKSSQATISYNDSMERKGNIESMRKQNNISYETLARAQQIERNELEQQNMRYNKILALQDKQFLKALNVALKK